MPANFGGHIFGLMIDDVALTVQAPDEPIPAMAAATRPIQFLSDGSAQSTSAAIQGGNARNCPCLRLWPQHGGPNLRRHCLIDDALDQS